jgi:glycerol-3-phosphate cytidylyltransferase
MQKNQKQCILLGMSKNVPKGEKIGFTCGTFDLSHAGHYLMLKESKENCDYLIVGLQVDPSIDRPEKNKPVQTLKERKIQLSACKYIDKIIVYKTEADLLKLLKKLKPNVRFIGVDHKGKSFTGETLPIKIFWNKRNHKYSSRNLRERVNKAQQLTQRS